MERPQAMVSHRDLDLRYLSSHLHQAARDCIERDNWLGFLTLHGNAKGVVALYVNLDLFKDRQWLEPALVEVMTAPALNNRRDSDYLLCMLRLTDRSRLRAAGDELPGDGPFTVYRGVAGKGRARHVRGLSWTLDLERAKWFARRFPDLADPAVFCVTVSEDAVLFYSDERQEKEVFLHLDVRTPIRRVLRGRDLLDSQA